MSALDDIIKKFRPARNSPEFAEARKEEFKELMLGIVKEHSIDGVWCESLALEEAINSL